ncbi:hypothetical protein PUNSTDRAFT_95831 [Punctularia strigosozonata HHB-11173 SS5]|uniref:uncharacterized protein n=1 Tax=Punctularia strigosozonata (strain HHB-11173) TaxID=741275 RepID=UPI0004416D54|nr:uncharacterized protein PUNSTDRAFT_95831 [Punctularia strigosozonata HHB-11173 SS5]EIN14182.1 hypothetical protein PUNSTDRAFT_95831 [Punctularia strigosozonata HHB-11173 SS5]
MPKETRHRTGLHQQSVRLPKRQFAAQDNAVEHVDVGSLEGVSGNEILASLTTVPEDADKVTLKKKDKLQLKRDLFLRRLEAAQSPYSKSHERRLRRRKNNQFGSGLNDMAVALSAVEEQVPQAVKLSGTSEREPPKDEHETPVPQRRKVPQGQIGEGKGVPLTQAQRKKALKTEQLRLPVIVANPEFAKNPFAAIRTHAQNTLLKHDRAS